jgi:hypothetical protein
MTEQKQEKSADPGVPPLARTISARPTISGHRAALHGARAARPRAEAPPPEVTYCYADEEAPTAALPKSVLNLLLQSTLPVPPDTELDADEELDPLPPLEPDAAPVRAPVQSAASPRAPLASAAELETGPTVIVAPDPVLSSSSAEETKPRTRVAIHLHARRKRSRRLPAALILGLLALGIAGALAWRWGLANGPRDQRSHPYPVVRGPVAIPATSPAAIAPPKPPTPILDLDADPTAAAEVPAVPATLPTTSLLAADGSETTAPTCEELGAGVPYKENHAWSDHVRDARNALVRGDVDDSQRGFCRAIRARNAPATVSVELARLLLLRRDAVAASVWVQQAISLAPNSTRVLDLAGDAAVRTGDLEEARSAWLRAAGIAEDDRTGIARLVERVLAAADTSLRERDPERAERLLRRVLAFRPDHAGAHAKLSLALARLGFPKSAELWSRRGIELAGRAG